MNLKEHVTAAMASLKAAITGEEPKVETPKADMDGDNDACPCCDAGTCPDCATQDGDSCSCHADCPGCAEAGCGGLMTAAQDDKKTKTEEAMEFTAEQKAALDHAQTIAKQNEELRAEIAKRDAEAKAQAEADAVKLEGERKARIASEADAFSLKCANAGRAATESLRGMFVAAKESGDEAQVTHLETIAASFAAVAPVARVPKDGLSAEEVAEEAKHGGEDIVPRAVKNLKARGVTEKSKNWSGELASEMAKLRKGTSNAAA